MLEKKFRKKCVPDFARGLRCGGFTNTRQTKLMDSELVPKPKPGKGKKPDTYQRSPGTNIGLAAREHSLTFALIRKLVLRPKPNVFSVHKFFLGHPYLRADLTWKSGTVASGKFGGLGWMQRRWNLLVFQVFGSRVAKKQPPFRKIEKSCSARSIRSPAVN